MCLIGLSFCFLAGMSCSDAGATYWAGDDGNPWGSVKYDSSTDPANVLFLSVDTGLARADVLGRAMVIYDAAGAPIACGIIEDGFACTCTDTTRSCQYRLH